MVVSTKVRHWRGIAMDGALHATTVTLPATVVGYSYNELPLICH